MSNDNSPVTEDELHAYVDGELPTDRLRAVETWLASHPEDAARVAAWRAQAEALRARFGAIAEQQVPARFKLDAMMRTRRSWAAVAAAAAIAAFLVGGVAGWMVRGASAAAPTSFELFTNEALRSHRLYIGEVRHPIEVKAEENHLVPWLSRRVGTNLRTPDLATFGLKLLGGRLLPGPNGPAALFMYEGANGERFTFYASKLALPQTAFLYTVADRFAAVHWIEGGIGFVLSGPADRERLSKVAQAIYEQMENRPPANERSSADPLISRRGS